MLDQMKERVHLSLQATQETCNHCFFHIGQTIHHVATLIQKYIRSYKPRRRWLELREEAKEMLRRQTIAAVAVTLAYRRLFARKKTQELRFLQNREERLLAIRQKQALRVVGLAVRKYVAAKELARQASIRSEAKKAKQKTKRLRLRQRPPVAYKQQSLADLQPFLSDRPFTAAQTSAGTSRVLPTTVRRSMPKLALGSTGHRRYSVVKAPRQPPRRLQYLDATQSTRHRLRVGSRPPTPEFLQKRSRPRCSSISWNFMRPTLASTRPQLDSTISCLRLVEHSTVDQTELLIS